jgi:hypothetical protein
MSLPLIPPSRSPAERQDRLLAPALFAFLLFFYLLTYSGAPHNPDEWFYLDGTSALLRGDMAAVQAHGWLFSWLIAPFYALSVVLPGVGSFQSALLLNIVVTAATATLLYLTLSELHDGARLRLAAALVFALCTLAWPYSQYLFRESAAGLALLAAMWAALRFWRTGRPLPLVAGVAAFACAVAIKQTTLALLPFYGVVLVAWGYRWWREGQSKYSSTPALLRAASTQGASHTARERLPAGLTNSIVRRAVIALFMLALTALVLIWLAGQVPAYARSLPRPGIFAALWVSPGWGLLFFSPVLLMAAMGALALARRQPVATWLSWGGGLFYVLLSTTNPFWWGYWAFGPRQLVPLLPLFCLTLPAGYLWLARQFGAVGRLLALGLVAVSFAVQLLGVATPFNVYTREVLFLGNVGGADVTWDWALWPLPGMLRFLRPEVLDFAWITGRQAQVDVRGTVLAPLLAGAAAALAWLAWRLRRDTPHRFATAVSALLVAGWLLLSVYLLHQVYLDERYTPELGFPAAAQDIRAQARPGDLLITDLWTENLTGPVVALINYCRGGCPPRLDLVRENLTDREQDWQARHRGDLAGHGRAWLVLERVAEGDPNSVVERWLGDVGYWEGCAWHGPQVRLCRYDLVEGVAAPAETTTAMLGEGITLAEVDVRLNAGRAAAGFLVPGDTVQVSLGWRAVTPLTADLLVSVQLLRPDGQLAAGLDRRPGNGFRPVSGWQPDETITDRLALEIPLGAPAGHYTLNVLMYDSQTGVRLPVQTVDGMTGDAIRLATVTVAAP